MTAFPIPELLARTAKQQPDVARWLAGLPAVVDGLARRWSLRVDAPFEPGGACSWTAPAGDGLVLKVGFPFASGEQRDEALALRAWDGNGAVRVHVSHADAAVHALLLERCVPGTRLRDALPEPERDIVIAGLLRRLWIPVEPGTFRPLADMCDEWADRFWTDYEQAAPAQRIDPGLARAGIALFRELPRTADDTVLLCTDLHSENVLASGREPWLVIDPKPYAGDPAYDLLQHMLSCADRLADDPGALADRMAHLTGAGPDRVRLWLFARAVLDSASHPVWAARMHEVARKISP